MLIANGIANGDAKKLYGKYLFSKSCLKVFCKLKVYLCNFNPSASSLSRATNKNSLNPYIEVISLEFSKSRCTSCSYDYIEFYIFRQAGMRIFCNLTLSQTASKILWMPHWSFSFHLICHLVYRWIRRVLFSWYCYFQYRALWILFSVNLRRDIMN